MGFFKSPTNQTKVPQPYLSLSLASQQDKVFKPNDTLSGQVTIITPYEVTPQAVEVALWGESTVWIRTSSSSTNSTTKTTSTTYYHYRDRAPLFNVTFNLLPAPYPLLPNQAYTFPFSFRVPEGTGFNRSGCYKSDSDERWTVFPHHLPPTFFVGSSPDTPDNCAINYGVTATLLRSGFGSSDPISATAPILFQPLNTNAPVQGPLSVLRYPKPFTLTSSTLTGIDPSSIGFRQRMHDRLSSSTPKMDFELAIEMPDLLTSGSEFRFRTTFNVMRKSENATHIPALQFRVLKLELLDFTFYRAPRDWDASNTMSGSHYARKHPLKQGMGLKVQEHNIYREKKTPLNSIPDMQVVELPEIEREGEKKVLEQAKHCEVWFTARVPGFKPPSFKSFAIMRCYRIKVTMGIEVGGKKFEYKIESHVRDLGSVPGENGV